MPLKEYVCKAHGEFESYSDRCPHGCSGRFVKQEIRTAPAFGSKSTRVMDQTTRDLAADFGLSDVRNDKEGGSVMDALRKAEKLGEFAPRWGSVGKEIGGSLGSAGIRGENNLMAQGLSKQIPTQIVGRHAE